MRLLDLNPLWILKDGKRVGFTFNCPTKEGWRQSCFFVPIVRHEQWDMFKAQGFPETQGCRQGCAWKVAGDLESADFSTLTVTPSLDGSAGGMWHGFITNGNIA